ncbi:hypothetical protein B1A_00384, partial [mine drainage metagenome]
MSPTKKAQTVPQVTSAQNAQEILLEMELALLQQIQEVPEGSDEKNRLQDLLSLLSARKSSESSSPSPKDAAPKTTSPDKGPNLSFASIIGEMSETMLRSSKRLDFGAMERAVKDRMLEETARNIETRLNEEIELNPAPFLCPECGRALQNKGMKSKTFTTSFGTVELRRRYGFCRSCR